MSFVGKGNGGLACRFFVHSRNVQVIPLALWDFEKQLKKGDNVIFTAFGAGFVHGASFYKWAYDGDKVAEAR